MYSLKRAIVQVFPLTIYLSASMPAFAGSFEDGVGLFNAKRYAEAKTCFQKALEALNVHF